MDALLCIGKDIILISEREENNLLPQFWKESRRLTGNHQISLLNLAFLEARRISNGSQPIPLSLHIGPATPSIMIDDISILALQVFNGQPMYHDRAFLLPTLLPEANAGKKNAIEIVSMRGNIHQLDKSDLDFFDVD